MKARRRGHRSGPAELRHGPQARPRQDAVDRPGAGRAEVDARAAGGGRGDIGESGASDAAERLAIREDEVRFEMIRAQGAGGQNVNKVSNAVHLRFDIPASSLPSEVKERLLALGDQRISADGVVVIKAQRHRSLGKNREDALARLTELIARAAAVAPERIATRPSLASRVRRVEHKVKRGRLKALRGPVRE